MILWYSVPFVTYGALLQICYCQSLRKFCLHKIRLVFILCHLEGFTKKYLLIILNVPAKQQEHDSLPQ